MLQTSEQPFEYNFVKICFTHTFHSTEGILNEKMWIHSAPENLLAAKSIQISSLEVSQMQSNTAVPTLTQFSVVIHDFQLVNWGNIFTDINNMKLRILNFILLLILPNYKIQQNQNALLYHMFFNLCNILLPSLYLLQHDTILWIQFYKNLPNTLDIAATRHF